MKQLINKPSYNKYITEGIQDGSIKESIVDGVRVYKVRRPKDEEEVVGYINLSGFLCEKTITEQSRG